MELVGERIRVRSAIEADAEALVDGVRSSLAELAPWLPWATDEYGREDANTWISGALGDVPPMVVVAPDGAVIGTCCLNMANGQNRNANLGYWLRTDRTGNGYVTEAVRLVAKYGLTDGGFRRLYMGISTRNEPSLAVARRAGATFEGTLRQEQLLPDGFHDSHMYSFVVGDL